jgi:4-hydroxybenzoate polyprenyltransferase
MILDIFAGFLIICLCILIGYAFSLAITFWFISIPLFCVWFVWIYKREKKRVRKPLSAQAQKDLDHWRASNEWIAIAKAQRKAERR